MKLRNIILGGAIVLAAAGCAKNVITSSNEQTRLYIEAWLKQNYPDATKEGNGIYVLENKEGTGKAFDGEPYAFVSYTASSMDGTISATTDEKISQQIGTYDPAGTYGGKIWYTEGNSLTVGIEDILKGMKVGGTKKALVPGWLAVNERKDKAEDYFKNTKNTGSTGIYEITLIDVMKDVTEWETKQLEDYFVKTYGAKLDTVKAGYYYKQFKAPTGETFKKDTSYYINYTGRLLNGRVFDTTIKDTAKKYDIYSSSKTYVPVKIKMAEETEDIKMVTNGSESTVITGFQYILSKLGPFEKGTGYFVSQLGYGSSGSGNTILPFTPLMFEIEVTAEPE